MKKDRNTGDKAIIRYNKLNINTEIYHLKSMEITKKEDEEKEMTSKKRMVGRRSPGVDRLLEQLKKISKTMKKKTR